MYSTGPQLLPELYPRQFDILAEPLPNKDTIIKLTQINIMQPGQPWCAQNFGKTLGLNFNGKFLFHD